MKKRKLPKYSKRLSLGIALALGCNIWAMSPIEAATYTAPITGDIAVDTVYADAGIMVDGGSTSTYTFLSDTTIKSIADGTLDPFGSIIGDSGDKITINATGNDLTLNTSTSAESGSIAGILTGTKAITITADKLNINTTAAAGSDVMVNGIWRAPSNTSTVNTTITADEVNIKLSGGNGGHGVAVLRPDGTSTRSSSTITINGALNIEGKTANPNAVEAVDNNAGIYVGVQNGKVSVVGAVDIDMQGNGIVANASGSTIYGYMGGNIAVPKGTDTNDYYSLYADNGGAIHFDMAGVSGLNAYSGPVGRGYDAQIDGDVYVGAGSTLNLGIEGEDSYLKGIVNNSGTMNMMLLSGGSWYNSATNTSEKDTVSNINNLSGVNAGIYQAADSNDINIAKYGTALGTALNVYYTHDASDPTKILGGNINITNAQAGSEIYMITDYDDNMNTADAQNKVLNALANKLYYLGYIDSVDGEGNTVTGERNLSGYAQIAEGLTTASVTKYFADINFNETTGQGSVADGAVEEYVAGEQTTADFTSGLRGNKALNDQYIEAGVYQSGSTYSFTKDTTITQTENNGVVAGPWLYNFTAGVASGYGEGMLTIDMNGNDLTVDAKQEGSVVGITAIGNGKVEIINPGAINVNAEGTGQTAALFVNGGGELHIANGEGNLEDQVVTITGFTTSSSNGALVKSMNGAQGRSWIKIDGLVDIHSDVTNGQGAGEAVSAVASTIDIGGGKIIATEDGTGETNFGGSNSLAIRAYGEFVTANYGIVNVNVIKEADRADAAAIGAGNNTTQIVGDFSTVGGMGTKGTINVGLNTADSYWYGDYKAGSGFGVTPGDYGCLNLWMGNGADWQGYTKYATNLVMDSGATWHGYGLGNNVIMDITDSTWYNWNNTSSDSQVRSMTSDNGVIDMTKSWTSTDAEGNETVTYASNVKIGEYSGVSKVIYAHDASDPTTMLGGDFTIGSAAADSEIWMVTDNSGINMTNNTQVTNVLDSLANKLYYTSYIDTVDEEGNTVTGERNLTGYVTIAEGLTAASVTKAFGTVKYDETTGQGSMDWKAAASQQSTVYTDAILGDWEKDIKYVKDGVLDMGTGEYNFTQQLTTIAVENNLVAGGPWVGSIGSAISGVANNVVMNMDGHDLVLTATNKGHSTGITAINKGIVEVNDPGEISINVKGTGQTAALFANGGGEIHINNGGDNLEDKVLTIRGWTTSSGNGALIKTMNGTSNTRSWIDIDGLVDIHADVTNGQGAGEAVSAVASTIDIGGGRIIATNDGTGETNFGGSNSLAIRAYGEFTSANYGIVNVNVTKEADTADAKATGAGDNTTQIVGDFSTVGGMGTKGTINVGLNTADSYWYGDYKAGSGWGVTPGDYGCLNLWMGNGADWQGYTKYATNLVMDTGATWEGYSSGSNTLVMTLKNEAMWTPTTAGTATLEDMTVRDFYGANSNTTARASEKDGYIYMSDDNAVNVTVGNYNGSTTLLYEHDASNNIVGGTFTVKNAAEGSTISMITDNTGIDTDNIFVVNEVLDNLANKLYYLGYVDGERNLDGYVTIAEGLTSASVSKRAGDVLFDETTGQGYFDTESLRPEIVYPEEQITLVMNSAIVGDASDDIAYAKAGILDIETDEYNFTADKTTINVENNLVAGGPWVGQVGSAISGVGTDRSIVLNLNGNDLEINATNKGHSTGITAINKGVVEVNDPGAITIDVQGTGQTAALFANGGGEIHINNGGENMEDKVLTITGWTTSSGNGALIKTMNGTSNTRSWIDIDGLVDIHADVTNGQGAGEAVSAVASTIDIGGGRIIATNDGTGETNFGGSNSLAIRAYGEFTSANYGIVNVNVTKEADTADAKATGAGDNTTQIVGDFSTVGGMGTKGTINVGLNTADSYWYGDYKAGSGWGVTPGDYGCLNLWMGNGADWQGYTKYATNLVMDTGATWEGYSSGSNTLVMTLKNEAMWTPTTAGTATLEDMNVRDFTGASGEDTNGYIYMSDENGLNVTVNNYSGNTTLLYAHDAEDPTSVIGGDFTIAKAAEGSAITLSTDNVGINMHDPDQVQDVLMNLANKLYYSEAVDGVNNLDGTVQIAEGLLTSSAALKVGDISYDVENAGQGMLASGSVITPEDKQDAEVIYGSSETAMMRGAKSAMASTAMMWRSENNDLMQRMGDLRLDTGESGAWAKYYGGKYEMDAQNTEFTTQYSAVQVGYDKKVGKDWIVGAAIGYNDADNSYALGGYGDGSVTSLSVYGTWQKDDGRYVDLVVKGSSLKNEYTIFNDMGRRLDGDYSTWGASLSAEFGKRFVKDNGFYVDPSVQLTIGRIQSDDYSAKSDFLDAYGRNKDLYVHQDGFNSVIGRIGVGLGQELKDANYYAKVALAHEFAGDFTTSFAADGEPSGKTSIDFGDTWCELQLGGSIKLSDVSKFYATYERNFGGDVTEKWRADAGFRFSF